MPFELGAAAPKKKIAVIGAGISGMGAAHMLSSDHRVVLIESEPRLGGHARTVMAGKRGDQPVDTGFIVFNYANYPHLAQLFDEIGTPVVKSNMSFGASIDGGRIEYGLASLGALFAQKRNLMNGGFLRMCRDIVHFNSNALRVANEDRSLTIHDFLLKMGTGSYFRDYYLSPLSGAIWSTPVEKVLDFPAHAMIQFFENHALLNHSGQHQWYTVDGGSIQYVTRLEAKMRSNGVEIRTNAPVAAVRRSPDGVQLRCAGGGWELFDEVVFATHTDVTLRLIADPSAAEQKLLRAIRYQPNDIVLHADTDVMPRNRRVWSSWNYTERPGTRSERIDLTYWMNSLQPIPQDDPHFVTLNSRTPIREEFIYDQVTLDHPVYDLAALDAQKGLAALNGTNRTWFCGAWMKHGFHEDGLSSAVDVVEAMRATEIASAVAAQ